MEYLTVTLTYDPIREEHLTKALRSGDYPDTEIEELSPSDNPITISSTPEGVRWVYDYLLQLENEYRNDGEEFKANIAADAADIIWQKEGESLPGSEG